ncbi:conserved hypothetical protein [Oenococcus oeni]|uniref:hypothetical protein n=1 Tax=Oenococcus oeni TaxID=1247 RepID=UPI0010B35799|nr:hypothetical protein [Oenococcus oeni]SYV99524.1 conserved hypothetical protein [Oenococcus oeni]
MIIILFVAIAFSFNRLPVFKGKLLVKNGKISKKNLSDDGKRETNYIRILLKKEKGVPILFDRLYLIVEPKSENNKVIPKNKIVLNIRTLLVEGERISKTANKMVYVPFSLDGLDGFFVDISFSTVKKSISAKFAGLDYSKTNFVFAARLVTGEIIYSNKFKINISKRSLYTLPEN